MVEYCLGLGLACLELVLLFVWPWLVYSGLVLVLVLSCLVRRVYCRACKKETFSFREVTNIVFLQRTVKVRVKVRVKVKVKVRVRVKVKVRVRAIGL